MEDNKTNIKKVSAQAKVINKPAVKKGSSNTSYGNNSKLIAICLVVSLFGGALGSGVLYVLQKDGIINDSVGEMRISADDGNKNVSESQSVISSVADKVSPSVVSISTATSGQVSGGVYEGAGTGIVVSSNGYIMTNEHVIDGAQNISITTTAGDVYEKVKLVGTDPLNDVAFLKVDGVDDMTPATIGNSLTLSIGQPVVAIGNSLGEYKNTVTSGIVSGLGRPVVAESGDGTSQESLNDLIQTDAAINPGNSGGPLVNLSGQVVGINTAVATDAQGIGFAIPISAVKGVLKGVVETGKISRSYIGVRYLDITPIISKEYKLSVKEGAYVSSELVEGDVIEKDGPADKAGIKDKDIITAVNGTDVGPNASLSSLISQYQPGDEVELSIIRGEEKLNIKVKLAEYKIEETTTQEESQQSSDELSTPQDYRWLFGF